MTTFDLAWVLGSFAFLYDYIRKGTSFWHSAIWYVPAVAAVINEALARLA